MASELALTWRRVTAQEAKELQLINRIAASPEAVLPEAIAIATKIASLSPDAVIVTRAGLREAWETGSVERASQLTADRYSRALMAGDNMRIGLTAFAEKKAPKWVASRL
jgi:enoyl-CoA hydratase/carnithine racemase